MGLEFQPLRTTNDLYFVSCFMLLANRISLVDEILISHTIHRVSRFPPPEKIRGTARWRH